MLSPLVAQRWVDPSAAAAAAQHAAALAHMQHTSPNAVLSPNDDEASNASMTHSAAPKVEAQQQPSQQQQQQRQQQRQPQQPQQSWQSSSGLSAMQDTPTQASRSTSSALSRQMACSSTELSCNSTVSSSNESHAEVSSVSTSVSPPTVVHNANSAFTYLPPTAQQQQQQQPQQDQRMEDVAVQAMTKPFGPPLVPVAGRAFTAARPVAMHGHAIGAVPMHYDYAPVVALGMGGYHHGQMSSQQGSHNGQQQQQQQSAHHSPALQPTRAHHSPNMTPQTAPLSNGATAKRGQGFSCHHCKTHKMPELLLFCSNQSKKGPGKKRCRKKYCDSCLKRLYGHPADQPLQSAAAGFQCPACLGNCVCAGCERKASGNGSAGAAAPAASSDTKGASNNEGGSGSSVEDSSHNSDNSPTCKQESQSRQQSPHLPSHRRHSGSIGSASSSASPSAIMLPPAHQSSPSKPAHMQQTKPTTPQGKPPVKKRRTSMDMGSVHSAAEESEGGSASNGATGAEMAASASSGTAPAPLHPSVHVRSSSGESIIPSLFHQPAMTFSSGTSGSSSTSAASLLYSPCHSRGNSGGAINRIPSPRLAALTAASTGSAGSRMIHLPPFTLAPSASGLLSGVANAVGGQGSTTCSPSLTSLSFSPFAPHIQQHVQQAVQQAAQQQQQSHASMEAGAASDSSLHSSVGNSILNSASPSLSTQSIGGLLTAAASAPCSPYATSRNMGARRMSAFSSVQGGPEGGEAGQQGTNVATTAMSGGALMGPSPTVSPSLFQRSLQINSPSHSSFKSSVLSSSSPLIGPSIAPASTSPTSENELIKVAQVLAGVACSATSTTASSSMPASATGSMSSSGNSSSLPPTHPVMSNRDAASPKLSGYMASVSLLSPSHSSGMMLPPSASAAALLATPIGVASQPLQSSVNLSVMQAQLKAQHQMEMQCLLMQQQQQLAELERMTAREVSDGQQLQQQQTAYWQQLQQQPQMRGLNGNSASSANSSSQPPSIIKGEPLHLDASAVKPEPSDPANKPADQPGPAAVSDQEAVAPPPSDPNAMDA